MAREMESKNVVLLESMKAYIELHYADQTLDLETIAGQVYRFQTDGA